MLLEIIQDLGAWTWAILGVLLLVAELLVPGVFMLWLGVAALAVAVLTIWNDIPWQMQIVLFGVFSIAFVFASRTFLKKKEDETDSPNLNKRGASIVGRTFTLDTPASGGFAQVRIDDTVWRVALDDAPAGSRIEIVSVDGAILQAKRLDA